MRCKITNSFNKLWN